MSYTREALGRLPLKGRPSCDVCGATERPLVCTLRDSYGDRTDACGRCAAILAPAPRLRDHLRRLFGRRTDRAST
jgi:hypothetical protein